MASTSVRWIGAALCVAAVLPSASSAQLSAGVKVDGITAQAAVPAVDAGATIGSTQLDATVSAGSRGTASGASGSAGGGGRTRSAPARAPAASGSRPGAAHATVTAPGTRIRADVGCLAVGAAVAGNNVSVAAGCPAGGDGRAASVAARSGGTNAVVTLSCLAGRAAAGNSVLRARLGRCSANDVGTAAGEASLAGGLASARAAVGCLRFLAAAGRLLDSLFVSPLALRFYTCDSDDESPALATTATSGQTTLTATVSCVVATLGGTVNALAEVGSCPGGADRNAADLAAGMSGTSVVGSVGCVAAAAAAASVSAGSCGGPQTAPEPGASQPPAGNGGNGPAGESPGSDSGRPGAGGEHDPLGTGARNDETKAAGSSSDRGPVPVLSGVKSAVGGSLPMTGLPLWAALFVGLALLAAGLMIVRRSKGIRGGLA